MKFEELYNLIKENFENVDELDLDFFTENLDSATQIVFSLLWADWMDSLPESSENKVSLMGTDITEVAPDYNSFMKPSERESLENKTYSMISEFEDLNKKDIKQLYFDALIADDQDIEDPDERSTPHYFFYYTLFKIMGHGISWNDNHKNPGFRYPYYELTYYDFPESFPEENEKDEEDWENEGEEWKGVDYDPNSGDWWKNK